jgi:hypothetical protein
MALALTTAILGTFSAAHAAVTVHPSGSILSVKGDDSANIVRIVQDDKNDSLQVYDDATLIGSYSSFKIKKIFVDMQDGNDFLSYTAPNGADYLDYEKQVKIDLGNGDDECWIDLRGGGIGGHIILRAKLDFQVKAGDGNDQLYTHFNEKQGSSLNLKADMGNGDDTFFGGLWGDVNGGAKVKLDVRGNKGYDDMSFWNTFDNRAYSYSSIDIASDSSVEIDMDGGDQDDPHVGVTQSGQIKGKYKLKIDTGTGNDAGGAYINLTPYSSGNVQAEVKGQGGNDDLSLEIDDNSGGWMQFGYLKGTLNGSGGTDTCTATPNVTKLSCEL